LYRPLSKIAKGLSKPGRYHRAKMSTQQNTITVLIAEDHEVTRTGIRTILNQSPDMQVIGEAEDGKQIKEMIASLRPRILLLDLIMPNLVPTELEKWVRTNYPETITLVLTSHDRDAYLSNMMDAGVSGYLDKKLRAGQLITAVRRAACGEFLFDKEQLQRARRWREDVCKKWDSLSSRESEVLQLLTEGAKNKGIAESLGVTVKTIDKHLENIYRKLGVTSRAEAIHWWVEKNT
jgi:DNA-binding NarL/FixJ family response regulator